MIHQVLAREPEPPSRRDPNVHRDLETIALRCLEKLPDRRYASGAEVAADLDRFLAGEPILARPIGRVEKLGRWTRRNRALAAALAALALVTIGGAVSGIAFAAYSFAEINNALESARYERERARDAEGGARKAEARALEQADVAEVSRGEAERYLAGALVERSRRLLRERRSVEAWATLAGALHLDDRAGTRLLLADARDRSARLRWVAPTMGVRVRAAALSADGRTLATADPVKGVQLWETASGRLRPTVLPHAMMVEAIAWSPEGARIATATIRQDALRVWDVASGTEPRSVTRAAGRRIHVIEWSPRGDVIAAGSPDGSVALIDTATWETRTVLLPTARRFDTHGAGMALRRHAVAPRFRPDGAAIAVGTEGGDVVVFDVADGVERMRLEHGAPVTAVAWTTDGRSIVSAGGGRPILLHPTEDGGEARPVPHPEARRVLALAADPRGGRLAVVSADASGGHTRIIDLDDAAVAPVELPEAGRVEWGPDVIALTATRHGIELIRAADLAPRLRAPGLPGGHVREVEVAPDGTSVTGRRRRDAVVLDPSSGAALATLARDPAENGGPSGDPLRLTTTPGTVAWADAAVRSIEGDELLLIGRDGTTERRAVLDCPPVSSVSSIASRAPIAAVVARDELFVVDGTTGRARPLPAGEVGTAGLDLSGDGSSLAVQDGDVIAVWDVKASAKRREVRVAEVEARVIALAGDALATAGNEGVVRLWDARASDDAGPARLRGHARRVTALAFSVDGARLASGDAGGTVRVWSVADRAELTVIPGEPGAVESIAFAASGGWLVAAHANGGVRRWDLPPRRHGVVLTRHEGSAGALAWSGDGRRLATGSIRDATSRVFAVAPGEADGRPRRLGTATCPDGEGISVLAFDRTGERLAAAGAKGVLHAFEGPEEVAPDAPWRAVGEVETGLGRARELRIRESGEVLALFSPKEAPSRLVRWRARGEETQTVIETAEPAHIIGLDERGDAVVWVGKDGVMYSETLDGQRRSVPASRELLVAQPAVFAGGLRAVVPALAELLRNDASNLRLHDVASGRLLWTSRILAGRVQHVSISPDERLLAAGMKDGSITLLDATDGRPFGTVSDHTSAVWRTAFSPDGDWLAATADDGTVRLWDVAPLQAGLDALVAEARIRTGLITRGHELELVTGEDQLVPSPRRR